MLLRTWQNLSFMAKRTLNWCGSSFIQTASSHIPIRTFAVSSVRNLKEIKEITEGSVTKIEGCIIPSERTNYVVPKEGTGCTLCKIHPYLKYTDVLILSQFLRPDGCLLPHYVTGVCRSQQFRLQKLVTQAQRAGKEHPFLILSESPGLLIINLYDRGRRKKSLLQCVCSLSFDQNSKMDENEPITILTINGNATMYISKNEFK